MKLSNRGPRTILESRSHEQRNTAQPGQIPTIPRPVCYVGREVPLELLATLLVLSISPYQTTLVRGHKEYNGVPRFKQRLPLLTLRPRLLLQLLLWIRIRIGSIRIHGILMLLLIRVE